jgi:hypothetical protein
MSRSNPMHHGTIAEQLQARLEPRRGPQWPFPPVLLPYPSLAPDARPARAPKPDTASMPDAPF